MDRRAAVLHDTLEANRYMTLATSDAEGRPWVSPVWFATVDGRELFWASRPETRHSQNIAARSQVAIVVFDSSRPPHERQAVYLTGTAEAVPPGDLDRALAIYSDESERQGLPAWTRDTVTPPGAFRLYRATATEHFVLDDHADERLAVDLDRT